LGPASASPTVPLGLRPWGRPETTSSRDCVVPLGSYYDGSKVVLCTAGSYCTGGPVDGAGLKQTPCPAGDTINPGAAAVGECFPICAPPTISCPAGCMDPSSDSKNCGACGNTSKDANACFGGTCSCGSAENICLAARRANPLGPRGCPLASATHSTSRCLLPSVSHATRTLKSAGW
jgi:hypothetical protein